MRILYFHDEKYPSNGTDTQQVMKNLSALHSVGADIVLQIPRFPVDWQMPMPQWRNRLFDFYGVNKPFPVVGTPCPIPYSKLRAEKLYHGLLAPVTTLASDDDLVYSRNLPPVVLAASRGQLCVYETYKPLPKTAPNLYRFLKPHIHKPNFLGIITHSEYARSIFIDGGVPPHKIVAIHNGFDPSEFKPRLTTQQARRKVGLPQDGFLVGYTGNMQKSKNLPYLIDLIAEIPEARLMLLGGTQEQRTPLEAYAQQVATGRVLFPGWVQGHKVPAYLYACDALAISPSGKALNEGGDTVLPMKLFQYLAAGRALYIPDLPDTSELVKHETHGLRTPPDQLKRNVADIRRLLTDQDLRRTLGDNCRAHSEQFTWKGRARKILDFVQENRPK